MSVPQLEHMGGVYQLRWLDEQIVMRIDRLHEDSKFSVTCEINITTTAPGIAPHIMGGVRHNLTSGEARRRLGKHLAEDIIPLNWGAMLEQASVKVLEAYREGTPVIHMADHSFTDRSQMRLDPIFQERQAILTFGEGDSLKSYFALFTGLLVKTGISHAGLSPEPGNVLYLDYETDKDTMWQRIDMITSGLQVAIPEGFYYREMHQPLAADIERINRIVMENAIEFLIVDSAAPAVLEPESASMTTEYFRALRSLQVTSHTVAHIPKGSKDEYPFGSSFWRNLPRANFKINTSREGDHAIIGLKNTKANNSRRLKDMGFEFQFDGNTLNIKTASIPDIPELAQGLPLREKIKHLLNHGAMTLEKLTEELEPHNQATINSALWRNKNMFVKVDKGWGNKAIEV